ncbi:hypothetical protein PLESTM_001503800 [Pleodorina starrii]|nr:hypothetical protein PLESTM_001503800 [Pleodorina starrii]
MAGLMSGLTLGLMSLDTVELEVLKRSGTPEERACAMKIMPVIKHQHFLLVTLLLCNAAATEALPLFIDRLADPVTAVALSVSVVLVFGEIIPQAVCSRYGLKVGAYSAWFVRILMTLCSPIAWPIGKLLDFMLGPDHSALFRRAQLKALVDLHGTGAGFGGTLSEDEVHVIRGALDLTNKVACKSMTPLDKVFMLSTEDRLDERALQAILMSGHSRIPVHREGNRKAIMGLILVKELVLINPADNTPVHSLRLRELPRLAADTPMYDMLKLFETGKSHMAVLTRTPGSWAGPGGAGSMTGPGGAPLSPWVAEAELAAASGPSALGGGRKQASASWQTHPRGSPFRRPGSAAGPVPGLDGYTALGDEYGSPPPGVGSPSSASLEPGEPVGIITIEDVIEELLQEEIIDETDLYIDNLQSQRVNAAAVAGSLPPRLRQVLSTGLFTPRVGRLGSSLAGGPGSPRAPLNDFGGSGTFGQGLGQGLGGGGASQTAIVVAAGAAGPAGLDGEDGGAAAAPPPPPPPPPPYQRGLGTVASAFAAPAAAEALCGSGVAAAVPAAAGTPLAAAAAPPPPHQGGLELRRVGGSGAAMAGGSGGLTAAFSGGRLSLLRGGGGGGGRSGSPADKDQDAEAKLPLLDADSPRGYVDGDGFGAA